MLLREQRHELDKLLEDKDGDNLTSPEVLHRSKQLDYLVNWYMRRQQSEKENKD
jgi:hypothetical protein